jgi:hypothetical protein
MMRRIAERVMEAYTYYTVAVAALVIIIIKEELSTTAMTAAANIYFRNEKRCPPQTSSYDIV